MRPFWNVFLKVLKAILEVVDKVVPGNSSKK